MSMNNSSTINEQLIEQLINNVMAAPVTHRVRRLYWSIINNSILKSITEYGYYVTLNPNDEDAVTHHGGHRKLVMKRYPHGTQNVAKALRLLRQYLPHKTAKQLVSSRDAMKDDSLYHAIYDFKFRCNSDFHVLFNLERETAPDTGANKP